VVSATEMLHTGPVSQLSSQNSATNAADGSRRSSTALLNATHQQQLASAAELAVHVEMVGGIVHAVPRPARPGRSGIIALLSPCIQRRLMSSTI